MQVLSFSSTLERFADASRVGERLVQALRSQDQEDCMAESTRRSSVDTADNAAAERFD